MGLPKLEVLKTPSGEAGGGTLLGCCTKKWSMVCKMGYVTHLQLEYIALKSFTDSKTISSNNITFQWVYFFSVLRGEYTSQKMKGLEDDVPVSSFLFANSSDGRISGEYPRSLPESRPAKWGGTSRLT